MGKFKEYLDSLIMEMRIVGQPDDNYFIVAYKDKIWVFSNDEGSWGESEREKLQDITDTVGIDVSQAENTYDVGSEITDENMDVVVGTVKDNELELSGSFSDSFDPTSSILIKKIFKTLKLKTLTVMHDDDSETFWDVSIESKIPDIMYHGTTSKYLMDIIRLGLRPNRNDSNWIDQNIIHPDTIFFTSKINEAAAHANMTADKQGGFPVILRMVIPDKELIIPDFDIETEANPKKSRQEYYPETRANLQGNLRGGGTSDYSAERLSQEKGIYGYKGAIMPKFIKEVLINFEGATEDVVDINEFVNYTVDYIKTRYREYGEYLDIDDPFGFREMIQGDKWELDQMVRANEDEDED